MMKTFKQYLLEVKGDPDTDDELLAAEAERDERDSLESSKVRALLLKDCAPFIKDMRKGGFLYRGSNSIDDADPMLEDDGIEVYKKTVRTDRQPLNSSRRDQVIYDKWFEDKFGYKARSQSMFCFAEENFRAAEQYGQLYMVFPIGDFEHVWSPKVADLQIYAEDRLKGGSEASEEAINAMLDKAGYKNTGFVSALSNRNEIMIRCKSYYAIPFGFRHDMHDLVM